MKKVLIGIAVLVVIVIAAAVIVPSLIPTETIVAQIVSQTKSATGRDLAIKGPVRISLLPHVAVEASDVAFSNAPGASAKDMATLSRLKVEVEPFALLRGAIIVDSFVLVEPKIALEIDKQGHPNWQFAAPTPVGMTAAQPAPGAKPTTPQAAPPAAKPAGGGSALEEIHLGDVRLVDGTISYFDARSGAKQQVDKINVKLALPDLASPMQASGGATWNGKAIDLTVDLANPKQFLAGQKSAIGVKLVAPTVKFDFKGEGSSGDVAKLDGDTALDIPSLRELAAWTGATLPATQGGMGPFKIAGKLDLAGSKISFSGAQLTLDEIHGKGDLAIDATGQRPALKGKLDLDKLDLNPYLPPEPAAPAGGKATATGAGGAPAGGGAAPGAKPAETAASGEWSDKPLDLSALNAANVDFALGVGGIVFKKITIGESALGLQIKDGRLAADLSKMALYQGSGKGSVKLDGGAPVPAVEMGFILADVQAEPLLKDAAGSDRLRGTMNGDIAVAGHGKSERDLIGNLNGKGALRFVNGAIRGINLNALVQVKNLENALLSAASQKDQETPFAELTGTFNITNGMLKNNDLKLTSPVLHATGAGAVDMPHQTVDYRLEAEASGIKMPVLVQGPWSNLSYRPQLEALLGNPQQLEQGLKGLLGKGGGTPAPSGQATPAPSGSQKPADVLRGLFGGQKQ